MLTPPITEQSREHHASITKVPRPKPLYDYDPPPADLEHTLFDQFPEISKTNSETKIPQVIFKELESDIEHVIKQLATVSNTYDARLLLTRKRMDEIDNQLDSIERYLSFVFRWSPGYNSGIDGMRNSLLVSKSHLELEKHTEKLKCLEECSRLEQSQFDLIRRYERLKTDLDLLAQVRNEGAP